MERYLSNQSKIQNLNLLKIGDIVILKRNQKSPADLLILDSNNNRCLMDGTDSNGKQFSSQKQALKQTMTQIDSILKGNITQLKRNLTGKLQYDLPSCSSCLNGYLKLKKDPIGENITYQNIFPKNAKLIYNEWLFGFVIYYGNQCKEQMILAQQSKKYNFYPLTKKQLFLIILFTLINITVYAILNFCLKQNVIEQIINILLIGDSISLLSGPFLYIKLLMNQNKWAKTDQFTKSSLILSNYEKILNIQNFDWIFTSKQTLFKNQNHIITGLYINNKLYKVDFQLNDKEIQVPQMKVKLDEDESIKNDRESEVNQFHIIDLTEEQQNFKESNLQQNKQIPQLQQLQIRKTIQKYQTIKQSQFQNDNTSKIQEKQIEENIAKENQIIKIEFQKMENVQAKNADEENIIAIPKRKQQKNQTQIQQTLIVQEEQPLMGYKEYILKKHLFQLQRSNSVKNLFQNNQTKEHDLKQQSNSNPQIQQNLISSNKKPNKDQSFSEAANNILKRYINQKRNTVKLEFTTPNNKNDSFLSEQSDEIKNNKNEMKWDDYFLNEKFEFSKEEFIDQLKQKLNIELRRSLKRILKSTLLCHVIKVEQKQARSVQSALIKGSQKLSEFLLDSKLKYSKSKKIYNSIIPEELLMLELGKQFNYYYIKDYYIKDRTFYRLQENKKKKLYEILSLNEYSKKRQRFSILVSECRHKQNENKQDTSSILNSESPQSPTKQRVYKTSSLLYVKGKAHVMVNILEITQVEKELLLSAIEKQKLDGKEALIYAMKKITPDDTQNFMSKLLTTRQIYNQEEKNDNLEQIYQELESSLTLLTIIFYQQNSNQSLTNLFKEINQNKALPNKISNEKKLGIFSPNGLESTLSTIYLSQIFDKKQQQIIYYYTQTNIEKLRIENKINLENFKNLLIFINRSKQNSNENQQIISNQVSPYMSPFQKQRYQLNNDLTQSPLFGQYDTYKIEIGITLNGNAFSLMMQDKDIMNDFFFILNFSSYFIGYNFEPYISQQFITFIKQKVKKLPKIMYLGSCQSDCPMLQVADVSISLMNKNNYCQNYSHVQLNSWKLIAKFAYSYFFQIQIQYWLIIQNTVFKKLLLTFLIVFQQLLFKNNFNIQAQYYFKIYLIFLIIMLGMETFYFKNFLASYLRLKFKVFFSISIQNIQIMQIMLQSITILALSKHQLLKQVDIYSIFIIFGKLIVFLIIYHLASNNLKGHQSNKTDQYRWIKIILNSLIIISLQLDWVQKGIIILKCNIFESQILTNIIYFAIYFVIQKSLNQMKLEQAYKFLDQNKEKQNLLKKSSISKIAQHVYQDKLPNKIIQELLDQQTISQFNLQINPYTLKFLDQSLEQKFTQQYLKNQLQNNFKTQIIIFIFIAAKILNSLLLWPENYKSTQMIKFILEFYFLTMIGLFLIYLFFKKQLKQCNSLIILLPILIHISVIFNIQQIDYYEFAFISIFPFLILQFQANIEISIFGIVLHHFIVLFRIFYYYYYDFKTLNNNILMIYIMVILIFSIYQRYHFELNTKQDFLSKQLLMVESNKIDDVLSILLPNFVKLQIESGINQIEENQGEVAILFCDVCDIDKIIESEKRNVVVLLDNLYRTFDNFCSEQGVQKIETVGKTYMACTGLDFCEIDLQNSLFQTEKTLRLIDLAFQMAQYSKQQVWGQNSFIELKIGIHVGQVIAGVIGYHKPQFSLIGDTVNTASRVCSLSNRSQISISKQAYEKVVNSGGLNFFQRFVEVLSIRFKYKFKQGKRQRKNSDL